MSTSVVVESLEDLVRHRNHNGWSRRAAVGLVAESISAASAGLLKDNRPTDEVFQAHQLRTDIDQGAGS